MARPPTSKSVSVAVHVLSVENDSVAGPWVGSGRTVSPRSEAETPGSSTQTTSSSGPSLISELGIQARLASPGEPPSSSRLSKSLLISLWIRAISSIEPSARSMMTSKAKG